jgi:hypothetical protein
MKFSTWCLLVVCLGAFAAPAMAQDKSSDLDFPPGVFTNGQKYHLADLKGKVIVLYFFDPSFDTGRAVVSQANDAVRKYKEQPFKFFAVAGGATPASAAAFARGSGLKMPVFADNLTLMEKRFGQSVAGRKAVRFAIIGAAGSQVGGGAIMETAGKGTLMYKDVVEDALAKQSPEWKFSPKDYDAKLHPALEQFEWGQYENGVKLLAAFRAKGASKKLKASADQLFDEVKKQVAGWKEEADKSVESKPVQAYDTYMRITKLFPKDDLAKEVAEPLKKLKMNKAILKELEARKVMAKVELQMSQMSPAQQKAAIALCKDVAKRFPGTPTAEHAEAMAKELASD